MPRFSTASSPRSPAVARSSSAPRPASRRALATARLAPREVPRRRRGADPQATCGSSPGRTRCRRCSCSCSRRSWCSTSRCPRGRPTPAAYGLLWVAIVFTALLGLARAWVPEQEHGARRALARSVRPSAIWLGKTIATLVFLLAAQVVALPAFVLFFAPLDATAVAGVLLANVGICAVGSLMAAMAAAGRAREVLLPLLMLPLAIPLVGGVGAAISPAGERYLFLALYDAVFAVLVGVVRVRHHRVNRLHRPFRSLRSWPFSPFAMGRPARAHRRARGRRPGPVAADLLHPRPDRSHLVFRFGLGPGRRSCSSGAGTRATTSRATWRSTRGRSSER